MPRHRKLSILPRKDQVSAVGGDFSQSHTDVLRNDTSNKSITKQRIRDGFRFHEWMPQVQPSTEVECTSGYRDSMIRAAGRPPQTLTQDQTDALIVLVVKTDIAYNDIPAAMSDILGPETGKSATKYKLRNHWKKIFGGDPQDARLGTKVGQLQRLEDHREACKRFYDQHNIPQQHIKSRQQEIYSDFDESDTTQRLSSRSGAENHHHEAIECGRLAGLDSMTRLGRISKPGRIRSEDTASTRVRKQPITYDIDSSSIATSQDYQGGARQPPSPISQSPRKRRSSITPKTISQVATKIDGGFDQLQWYLQYRRSRGSWFSRISGSSRSSSYRERQSQTLAPLTNSDFPNRPDLHDLLNQASYASESLPWALLGERVDSYVRAGADVNGFSTAGETPLHRAVKMGCLPAVVALLEAKANPNAKDAQGKSVSASSREFIRTTKPDDSTVAHIEVARELIKYNADLEDTPLTKQIPQSRKSTSRAGRILTSLPESHTIGPPSQQMAPSRHPQYEGLRYDALGLQQLDPSAQHHGFYTSNQDLPVIERASNHVAHFSNTQHLGTTPSLVHRNQTQPYRSHSHQFSNASTLSFNTALSNDSVSARNSMSSLGFQIHTESQRDEDEASRFNIGGHFNHSRTSSSLTEGLFPFYTDPNVMPFEDGGAWPGESLHPYHQTLGSVTIATDPNTITNPSQRTYPAPTPNVNRQHRVINGNVHSPSMYSYHDITTDGLRSGGQEITEPSYYDAREIPYDDYIEEFEPGFSQTW